MKPKIITKNTWECEDVHKSCKGKLIIFLFSHYTEMHISYILDHCQCCAEVDWEKVIFLPVCEFSDAIERKCHKREVYEMNKSLTNIFCEILSHGKTNNLN